MLLPLFCLQITADNILPFKVDEENLVLLSLRHISGALPHSSAYFRLSEIKAASKQSTVYITLRVNRQVAQRNTGSSNKEFHKVRDSPEPVLACMRKLHNHERPACRSTAKAPGLVPEGSVLAHTYNVLHEC